MLARVVALADVDFGLAAAMTARLVDRFLVGAGSSTRHRYEAIAQTMIDVGLTDDDRPCHLDFKLPLGAGDPSGYVWDGAEANAEAIVDNAADAGIRDVLWEPENVGRTGWEPEFDQD